MSSLSSQKTSVALTSKCSFAVQSGNSCVEFSIIQLA
jgi:hypothetical protein